MLRRACVFYLGFGCFKEKNLSLEIFFKYLVVFNFFLISFVIVYFLFKIFIDYVLKVRYCG